jgi:hypothetical protein
MTMAVTDAPPTASGAIAVPSGALGECCGGLIARRQSLCRILSAGWQLAPIKKRNCGRHFLSIADLSYLLSHFSQIDE